VAMVPSAQEGRGVRSCAHKATMRVVAGHGGEPSPTAQTRAQHEPLRPELAASLGFWLSSQLAQCAGGARWRL
jgi:hypothetical protein